MSRYNTTPGAIFKGNSMTYYVLKHSTPRNDPGGYVTVYKAYDSSTSALLCSSETLEGIAEKCLYLGYRKEDIA